jgi:methylmalonyl-CoA carboxyltransferase large subunit
MRTEATSSDPVLQALAEVRRDLARLGTRVAALEAAAGPKVADGPTAAVAAPPPAVAEDLSEELVMVLGAAVAAFLGKTAPIRQIHLVGTTAWAQQGRVAIQASHTLEAHRVRSDP